MISFCTNIPFSQYSKQMQQNTRLELRGKLVLNNLNITTNLIDTSNLKVNDQ